MPLAFEYQVCGTQMQVFTACYSIVLIPAGVHLVLVVAELALAVFGESSWLGWTRRSLHWFGNGQLELWLFRYIDVQLSWAELLRESILSPAKSTDSFKLKTTPTQPRGNVERMKRTLLLLSRGLKSVGGDTSRVSLETINKFLNSNGLSYKDGHASFLVKCTRCDIADGAQRPTVFVNKTTGSALCDGCSLSGNKQLFFLLHRKSSLSLQFLGMNSQNGLPDKRLIKQCLNSYQRS